jgi:hypothetical protein
MAGLVGADRSFLVSRTPVPMPSGRNLSTALHGFLAFVEKHWR